MHTRFSAIGNPLKFGFGNTLRQSNKKKRQVAITALRFKVATVYYRH